ncbi:hypothetical protein C4D60_Mb11t00020 [Musa balbisiana]|uniref:Uncharacterized protein n=1 Tax=Musa balbisiana TaxID=52838 RepID=A0A4S8J0Q0_MUSBA|nr:hypothetical protein C4D60_Mb11t00020 [Musa balbisiana]
MDMMGISIGCLWWKPLDQLSECGKFFMASQGGHRPQPVNECDIYSGSNDKDELWGELNLEMFDLGKEREKRKGGYVASDSGCDNNF